MTVIFLAAGLFFLSVGCFGLIRMPDLFCRMHAAAKSTTLGLGFILIASFVHLGFSAVGLKAILAIVFSFLTAPVGAHLISRAAYQRGVELYHRSAVDELKPFYSRENKAEEGQDKDGSSVPV